MTRKSIGSWSGLALLVIVACTGGGAPNDFSGGSDDDAPFDPGAPSDPNAPPTSTNDPPFGGVAPPPPSQPPGGGGTSGMGGGNCMTLCNELAQACQLGADAADIAECIAECEDFPGRCFGRIQAYYRCGVANDCSFENDACEPELLDFIECLGPTPPGEGGQGGM